MTDQRPIALTEPPSGYHDWLVELKSRIHNAQQRATLAVNRELVALYWQIGSEILTRQAEQGWGAKVIERLAHDLRTAFPGMKGFSRANLMYMRAFAEAWPDAAIVQQAVGQLPWGHNLVLLSKQKDPEQRLAYARRAIEHGWSRNVLNIQIETSLLERTDKAVTNFEAHLLKPHSDLARESLKDPYRFDFLGLTDEALDVGGDEFFIDLLFYHLKLRCYVVIELKGGKFKPDHLGQLGFYLTAVDRQVKNEQDNPTIGLLLCKSKNKVVAEYALSDKSQPMGIAEYKLLESLPAELQTSLPSIEQIEQELASATGGDDDD